MKTEPLCTLQESVLQHIAEDTRNKYIRDIYDMIIHRITEKTAKDWNFAYNNFPRFNRENHTLPANTILEFYTPKCNVKMIVRRCSYMIVLTIPETALQTGNGMSTNEIIRIAFDATRYERGGKQIDDVVDIKIDNNVEAVYNEKHEQMIYERELRRYNKKMRIEG